MISEQLTPPKNITQQPPKRFLFYLQQHCSSTFIDFFVARHGFPHGLPWRRAVAMSANGIAMAARHGIYR